MALLKDDTAFTHVIAIDFGTGASGFGLPPRILDKEGKPRIEVFNPCDDSDDQKTPTAILFDNNDLCIEFGSQALQKYASMLDDGETVHLFQNVKNIYKIRQKTKPHKMQEQLINYYSVQNLLEVSLIINLLYFFFYSQQFTFE